MVTLEGDRLVFRFPDVHEEAQLTVTCQRTLRIPDDDRHLRVLGHQALVAALDNGGSMARLLSCSGLPARTRSPVSTGQRDRSRLSRLRCPLASIRHAVVPRPLRADGRPLPYGGSYGWGCEAHETGGAARRKRQEVASLSPPRDTGRIRQLEREIRYLEGMLR
jgi:hypothetical protein